MMHYLSDRKEYKFTCTLLRNNNSPSSSLPCGYITGIFTCKNLPKMGQLIGGIHMETGIVKGQPLIPSIPLPKVPMVELDNVSYYQVLASSASMVDGNNNNINDTNIKPLPPGWERRVDQ